MRYLITILLAVTWMFETAAQSLTIEECYTLAEQNYPLVRQRDLIEKSKGYSIENVLSGNLPQIAINGQATYQSDVTAVPVRIPGQEIEPLSKDQYKLYTEVTQTIYDGGVIRQQKEIENINAAVESGQLEVELYKIRERINQLFFGLLLTDEQIEQTRLLKSDIELGLKRTEAAVANGTALKSNLNQLKAELLKVEQRNVELSAHRNAYLQMLGRFINRSLTGDIQLVKPESRPIPSEVTRPELRLFDMQMSAITARANLTTARNRPKVSLFVQGGVGRPALNMLSNDLEGYYLGGVRLHWPLSTFYNRSRDRALAELDQQSVHLQKEAFLFNTGLASNQIAADVSKYASLLSTDDEIIALRDDIKKTAAVQLEHGAITTTDYLREVNAEDQARLSKIVHEIQWLMAQYALETINGTNYQN